MRTLRENAEPEGECGEFGLEFYVLKRFSRLSNFGKSSGKSYLSPTMTIEAFVQSLQQSTLPATWRPLLLALWHAGKDDGTAPTTLPRMCPARRRLGARLSAPG